MCRQTNESDSRISVLIVEDHPIYREALIDYLETRPDQFHIVGDVARREEALRLVKEYVPDIVLLDLALPEETEQGLQAIQEICDASPSTKIVVLTQFRDNNDVFRAIQAGAAAYLLKDHVYGKDVIDSLLLVNAGERPMDPEIAQKLYDLLQHPPVVAAGYMPLDKLTERELEVLDLIAKGKSNQDIAEILVIAYNTVKKHVSNILSKLQMQNRIEAAIYYRTEQSQPKHPSS
jgi:NarL family two-component system response regulator LiaR